MIEVQIANPADCPAMACDGIEQLVRHVCRRFGVSRATVSIAVVSDSDFRSLNRRHLGHDRSSDCLSFDLSGDQADTEGRFFELVVNGDLAVREAATRGHSVQAELALYVTHGLLHQVGFDDTTAARAELMHEAEDQILDELGYGPVYNTTPSS